MNKVVFAAAALLLAACAGMPGGEMARSLLTVHNCCHKQYVIFAFDRGDVTVELHDNPRLNKYILDAVTQGYYNGSFVYDTTPGRVVMFGEAYWQGVEPSPRWLLSDAPRYRHQVEGGDVALPVLAQPTPTSLIVGPQIIMGSDDTSKGSIVPAKIIVIGKIVEGADIMREVQKGDKVLSAVVARPVAK